MPDDAFATAEGAEPVAVDREFLLVEAFKDYLTEIEANQKALIAIAREALHAALEALGSD